MEKTYKNCQSCGMPMKSDPQGGGSNADGSKNMNYCSYCYQDGNFTFEGSMKEFQAFCKQKMKESGHSGFMSWLFTRGINRLERWKQN